MKLFGNRLSVISVHELFAYAARSTNRFRLELCPCKELGKLVTRVIELSTQQEEERLGVLVDDHARDYFVTGWSDAALRDKLQRLLLPLRGRADIVLREDGLLHLFQGDTVMATDTPSISPVPVPKPSAVG